MNKISLYSDFPDCELDENKKFLIPLITGKEWDVFNQEDARTLALSLVDIYNRQWNTRTLQNFYLIPYFNKLTLESKETDAPDWDNEFYSSILFKDNNKKKTIIALSGMSWPKELYTRRPFNHDYIWLGSEKRNYTENYNIISFKEDLSRVYDNPLLFNSSYYKGINNEIDSLDKMVEYVKQKFPDNEYYVLADCKSGHSGALFASKLQAKKCFLIAPFTRFDTEYWYEYLFENDKIGIKVSDDMPFYQYIKTIAYPEMVNDDELTMNDIIRNSPSTQFKVMYHVDDHQHYRYPEHDKSLTNVIVESVSGDKFYTCHYIVPELESQGYISSFFED